MTYHLENSIFMTGEPKIKDWHNPFNYSEGMSLGMINWDGRLSQVIFPALEKIPVEKRAVVLDAGCGTGMIGLKAIETGSKFVYFIEHDAQMIKVLKNVLPKLLKPHQYKIIGSDLEKLKPEWFDNGIPQVVTSELFGPTLFDEGYVSVVAAIKKLFPRAVFIPETFAQDIFLTDVDYSYPIWPQSAEGQSTLEHYKFLHHSKGWNTIEGNFYPEEKTKVGVIKFKTANQVFKNAVEFKHQGKEQLVYIQSYVTSHGYKSNQALFGFYLPKSAQEITYKVEISLATETLYRPLLTKVES